MYFVNVRKKLSSSNFLLHVLPAGAVFITMIALTALSWRNAEEAFRAERQTSINNVVSETRNGVIDRLESYRLVLLGASGLFVSSDDVTRDEWRKFISSFNIQKNYPGVKGLGYMTSADREELPALIRDIRADGFKNAVIHPDTEESDYAITTYFVPQHPPGLGYNMFSHPARKNAIGITKETGEATISDRVIYTKTEMPFSGVGFSMYLPVSANSEQQIKSPSERNLRGYVFAPFLAEDFFTAALEHSSNNLHGLRIYDGAAQEDKLLYQTANFASLDKNSELKHSEILSLFGQEWIMDFRFSPDIIAETTRNRPLTALVAGAMLSVLLAGFVLTLLIARTRVLAHSKQAEIQSAKDELLSLASHQLRTPATSVKQYVGMVLEGFAGKLTSQQTSLLDKAYESNERQLHIINEILYVAKIDAKGIVLTPRRLNINKLLRELTQELSVTAKKSKQKIRLLMPKKQTYVEADEHSLRMALENLISNALKYSHEGTTTTVKLTAKDDEIHITVKDKGVGIDAEDLPLLFQRFSRIPNELSKQTSGSGIGLYLSQQLIQLHNGDIKVSSVKDKGTTFTVILPKVHTP